VKALVLAAGLGTRMRPLTEEMPKCLLPVGGRPLLAHILELLSRHGVREVFVNLYWHAARIRETIGSGHASGVDIEYLEEDQLSGTAGPIRKLARQLREDRFLVLNGDNLTNLDLSALTQFHQDSAAELTIALHREEREDLPEKSVVETDAAGRIIWFIEKPAPSQISSEWSSGGVYVFEPQLIECIPEGRPYDLGHDLIPSLLSQGQRVFGFKSDFYLVDIGTPQAYERAQDDLVAGRVA
jgi:mannose-1-phosphate guanylyltransferase / phosphomannomutase